MSRWTAGPAQKFEASGVFERQYSGMLPENTHLRRISGQMPPPQSPQARSNRRLAIVACTVLATMCLLVLVILQAQRAEQSLDEATAHTLRDYTGYAGRLMGGEVLRHFADEREDILAPVTGSARRAVPAPLLDEIVTRGKKSFNEMGIGQDQGIGYFRLDVRTGAMETRGGMSGDLAKRVADTLRTVITWKKPSGDPDIVVLVHNGVSNSVGYATLVAPAGTVMSVYGFNYPRAAAVAAISSRVFRETPLLPTSFTGARWNYDTTRVHPGDVVNDSLLVMRITDREGRALWESERGAAISGSRYRAKTVLSTASGGMVVESAIRSAAESSLIPSVVRRAQRWSLGALLALTVLLAAVSLVALGGERMGVRARRVEAMQQLALGLRHELNNALASVMLNAELLGEDVTLDASARERVQAIVEQADRMRVVLRRLEKSDRLDMMVPYLNEGFMVDLSTTETRAVPDRGPGATSRQG